MSGSGRGCGGPTFVFRVRRLTDTRLTLEDLWGASARRLLESMANAGSPQQCASLLGQGLRQPAPTTPLQRALAWMAADPASVSLDDVAFQSGLSPRQFRRVCVQHTGVSPKLLARVLRFRKALAQVQSQAGPHADVAADCGYFDQSHFIAEFQRFAGQTPADYLRDSA